MLDRQPKVNVMTETTIEAQDVLQTIKAHRAFLLETVRDLTDEQASQRTTARRLLNNLGFGARVLGAGSSDWWDARIERPER